MSRFLTGASVGFLQRVPLTPILPDAMFPSTLIDDVQPLMSHGSRWEDKLSTMSFVERGSE